MSNRPGPADAQEQKRFSDDTPMQTTLNEYGATGWELVMVGMGDMSAPRLIFKK